MTTRRTLLAATAMGIAVAAMPAMAQADYPSEPIRWIVPFPPGGAMDAMARTLADILADEFAQPVTVENMPGAGGNIGKAAVARAANDGHTMVIVANGMAVNQYLYPSIAYDPVDGFEPVSLVAIVPNVLVTNAEHNPARTVDDVIEHAGAAPEVASVASAGVGTSIHLASEMFQSMTGVQMLHVPYRGSSPAVADMLTGRVDYMFDSITSAKPNIESGTLYPIAVTTSMRSSALPDVPTVAEAGIEGYDLSPWFGVFMPAGVPEDRVERMNAALTDALGRPEVQERFASIGAEIVASSPQELADHLQNEMATWSVIIEERGIRAE